MQKKSLSLTKRLFPRVLPDGTRAQASAPFELFVAVIIMTFVVVVGYQVLESVSREVCLNSVEREMTTFKIKLEDTVARKSSNKFMFSPQGGCFESKGTIMKIDVEKDSKICANRCGYPSDSCYVMTFANPNIAGAFRQKCLELPPYTTFATTDCGQIEGPDSADYGPIDPISIGALQVGSYITRNISAAGETYPNVCVFYKSSAVVSHS